MDFNENKFKFSMQILSLRPAGLTRPAPAEPPRAGMQQE